MYTLKNWSFGEIIDGRFFAEGNVYGHHRLRDGDYIYTSNIENMYLCADNEYLAETLSGSLYRLLVEEMNPQMGEATKAKLKKITILNGTKRARQLEEKKEVSDKKRKLVDAFEDAAKKHMDEDGLYLMMESLKVIKAVLKKDSNYKEIEVDVHLGMFQDSVLITDWEGFEVDFRYFPSGGQMKPYQWSDGLECIFIHNIGRYNIEFQGKKQTIKCKGNMVTKITKEKYQEESKHMIYLAGDIHGELEIDRVVDFFDSESLVRELTEDDYLILLGDVGLCWDDGKKDAYVRKILESLPVTTLWIDGNHENFDLIDELPITNWHGGKVQYIGKKIIHLMRGYVYDICGRSFFAFGGGFSIDKIYRREGISWWPREMPSEEEYERGRENLSQVGNQVDYIITHTAPAKIAEQLVPEIYPGEEELQYYFQDLAEKIDFERWFFGHWHVDRVLEGAWFVGLYDEIARIEV